MEEPDELDDYIDSLINEELSKLIIEKIGPFTCQFLKQDTVKGLVPFASGVLAELGGSYYILTASHVIEDWSDANRLFVEIKNGHISVVGKGCATEIEKDTNIDVAYIKLKDGIVPILKQWYSFLTIDRFLNHEKIFDEANYCAFGYPVVNQKIEKGKLKTFGSAYYMRPHQDKVFEYYNLDPLSHYVLEYKGKAVNIKTGESDKIKTEHYGLSGGGLWYTTIEHDEEKFISNAHLIGIMTEFRKGKYECLIANRIENILASLHENEGLDLSNL